MSENKAFIVLLIVNFFILLAQISTLSISYHEAAILYGEPSFLKSYINIFTHYFGNNDYALRLPMILIHLFSTWLLYLIASHYVSKPYDRVWIVLIYMLLPGITSAALLVNSAGFQIAAVFLFGILYLRFGLRSFALLPLFLLFPQTALLLYCTVAFFTLAMRQWVISAALGGLILFSGIYFGFEIGGRPEGRFLDALGLYAAIFSPIVFVYIFYALYRRFMSKERDLLWSIATGMFLFSLILSFRQKVDIHDFAPYLMLAIPLAANTFFHTYRARLPRFRRRYRILFYSAFATLIVSAFVVFLNPYWYRWMDDPHKHFSYSMHVAKELASELKTNDIECISADEKMQLRLRFYGISECNTYHLVENENEKAKKVTIRYIDVPIYTVYVTK